MASDTSPSSVPDSLHAHLTTLGAQLGEQLHGLQERLQGFARSIDTMERSWMTDIRPQLAQLERFPEQTTQLREALARLDALTTTHTELKSQFQQQMTALIQAQALIQDVGKADGLNYAEQRNRLERIADQLQETRRIIEKWGAQSEQKCNLEQEIQKLLALLDRKVPEVAGSVAALANVLQARHEESKRINERLQTLLEGTRDAVGKLESGLWARLSQQELLLSRLETTTTQTHERLAELGRGNQQHHSEQQQGLASLVREVAQLGPLVTQALAGDEAIRSEIKPLAVALNQVQESQRKTDTALPKVEAGVTTALPQQIAALGSDIRAGREELKPLAAALNQVQESQRKTDTALPKVEAGVTMALPQQIAAVGSDVRAGREELKPLAAALNQVQESQRKTDTALPKVEASVTMALPQQIAAVSSDVRAGREELKPLAAALNQVQESQRKTDSALPKVEASVTMALPQQIAAVGSDVRSGREELKPLAAALNQVQESQRKTDTALPKVEASVTTALPQQIAAVGSDVRAGREELKPLAAALNQVQESQRKTDTALPKVEASVMMALPQQIAAVGSDVRGGREDLKPLATAITEIKTQTGSFLPAIQQAVTGALPDKIVETASSVAVLSRHMTSLQQDLSRLLDLAGRINQQGEESGKQLQKEWAKLNQDSQLLTLLNTRTGDLPKQLEHLQREIVIKLDALGVTAEVSGSKKALTPYLNLLFYILMPILVAAGAFYILHLSNDSMNIKRLTETVEEKRILDARDQQCQTDLSTAKLDVERAKSAFERHIAEEEGKAKQAKPVISRPLPSRKVGPSKSPVPSVNLPGTVSVSGTLNVTPIGTQGNRNSDLATGTTVDAKPTKSSAQTTPLNPAKSQ